MEKHLQVAVTLVIVVTLSMCEIGNGQTCVLPNNSAKNDTVAMFMFVSGEKADCQGGASDLTLKAREFLEEVNQKQNITLGLQVIPACNSSQKMQAIAEVLHSFSGSFSCGLSEDEQSGIPVGVIMTSPELLNLEDILEETKIPIVYIGETLESPTNSTADNVYYTNGDLVQKSEAIANLAVELNWDYVTVGRATDPASLQLYSLLEKELKNNFVCVGSNFTFDPTSPTVGKAILDNVCGEHQANGVILLGAPNNTQIVKYGKKPDRSWIVAPSIPAIKGFRFDHYYEPLYILNQHQSHSTYTPNLDQMVLTLASISESVQTVLLENCSNQLQECVDKLQSLVNTQLKSTTFNSSGILTDMTEGSFKFENHRLQHKPPLPVYKFNWGGSGSSDSWCIGACQQQCKVQINLKNYIYVPGDYTLIVTMPIHDSFEGTTCRHFNDEASSRAEAAIFARKRLKELLDLEFGLLVLDSCLSTAITQKLLADALYGSTDYCNSEGVCLDRTKIIGIVGDFSSHITMELQRFAMAANIVQVSYSGSTPKLDDKTEYPNLLRTHPSVTRENANIVKLIGRLNKDNQNDIRSVVIMHTDSLYGTSTAENLEEQLREEKYCILKKITLKYSQAESGERYETIFKDLSRNNKSDTSFVVLYAGEEKPITDLLDAMSNKEKDRGGRWWKQSGSIMVIGKIWERKEPLIQQYGDIVRGSLTFKVTPNFSVSKFEEHLKELRANTTSDNPWFTEMYQRARKCKVRGSFVFPFENNVNKVVQCTQNVSYTESNDIVIELYTTYTIKAIYTFGYGLKDYARDMCDGNLTNCGQVFNRTFENVKTLREKIQNVRIPNGDSSTEAISEPFDDNRDGKSGFEVFSMRYKADADERDGKKKYEYELIYRFDGNDDLSRPIPKREKVPDFYKNSAVGDDIAIQDKLITMTCSYSVTTTTESIYKDKDSNNLVMIISVCSASGTVILLVVVIVQALMSRRRRSAKHMKLTDQVSTAESHFTTVPEPEPEPISNPEDSHSADEVRSVDQPPEVSPTNPTPTNPSTPCTTITGPVADDKPKSLDHLNHGNSTIHSLSAAGNNFVSVNDNLNSNICWNKPDGLRNSAEGIPKPVPVPRPRSLNPSPASSMKSHHTNYFDIM